MLVVSNAHMGFGDDTIYRVEILGGGWIYVKPLGLLSRKAMLRGLMRTDDERVPDWFMAKLAALGIMSTTPPTTEVEGIGKRISDRVFWVYEDRPDGNNA